MKLLKTLQYKWWLWQFQRRHNWLKVSEQIPSDKRHCQLYRKLQKVERQIIKIAGAEIGHCRLLDSRQEELLSELLSDRCYLLNQMFVATPDTVARMEQLNTLLHNLTQKMYDQSAKLYRRVMANAADPEFDDDIEIEGTLQYHYNGDDSVLRLPDDAYYGSNFNRMIELVEATEDPGDIASAHKSFNKNDSPEMSDAELGFEDWSDDGTSWAEGWLRCKEFDHICICHAIHDICTHKHYSIPDLLRLNDFWCEVTIKHQHIVAQNGLAQNFNVL